MFALNTSIQILVSVRNTQIPQSIIWSIMFCTCESKNTVLGLYKSILNDSRKYRKNRNRDNVNNISLEDSRDIKKNSVFLNRIIVTQSSSAYISQ